jgi:hypothetical protein
MARITIEQPKATWSERLSAWWHGGSQLIGGCGTVVKLDGREVRHVRSVSLSVEVDNVVKADIEVLASEDMSFDLPADVTVQILPAADSVTVKAIRLENGMQLIDVSSLADTWRAKRVVP